MPAWSMDLPLAPLVSADLPSRRPEREAVPALVGERPYGTRNVPRCQYVLRHITASDDGAVKKSVMAWATRTSFFAGCLLDDRSCCAVTGSRDPGSDGRMGAAHSGEDEREPVAEVREAGRGRSAAAP